MDSYRKLMVLGINKLIDEKLISLTATESSNKNWDEYGHFITNIDGEPTVISWNNIGHDELRISVWWKYDHSEHPHANLTGNSREEFKSPKPLAKKSSYPNFVGVTVSGWLERKTSKHLQGKGRKRLFDIYTRSGEKEVLDKLPTPKPEGYASEGTFYL